ncbi:MAG: hypothetical protein K2H86_01780 [Muribaculaceae bacterium]|nr:hypothetical protein [Muribaculaceae bacterium]
MKRTTYSSLAVLISFFVAASALRATPPDIKPQITADGITSSFYLIGSDVNGHCWELAQEDCKFVSKGNGIYEWNGEYLSTGFKINNGSWGQVNIGAGDIFSELVIGEQFPYINDAGSGNIGFEDCMGVINPRVVLDIENATITVTGQKDSKLEYFFTGDFNQWNIGEGALKMTKIKDGIYSLTNVILPESGEFKIASTGWIKQYGGIEITPGVMSTVLYKVGGEGDAGTFKLLPGIYNILFILGEAKIEFTKVSTVDELLEQGLPNTSIPNTWVTGYIVGCIEGPSIQTDCNFSGYNFATEYNILLAGSSSEDDYSRCIPVQLPFGDIRAALNLVDHPENLGHQVTLCGSNEKYFGVNAIKSVNEYEWVGEAPVVEEVKYPVEVTGTAERPLTVEEFIEAQKYGNSIPDTYLKGVIVGYVPGMSFEESVIGTLGTDIAATNILVSAEAYPSSLDNCVPVQLPTGAVRDAINLKDNPGNLGRTITLAGVHTPYFGQTGLKEVYAYTFANGENINDLSGVYFGITAFNHLPKINNVKLLDDFSKYDFFSFVNAQNMDDYTYLYYSVEEAINELKSHRYPSDLANVTLITFTDGNDDGSLAMKPDWNDTEYQNHIRMLISNTEIQGHKIGAYTIGLKGKEIQSPLLEDLFRSNLKALASEEKNATEVENMNEVNRTLNEIIDQLQTTWLTKNLKYKINMRASGDIIRFTLDKSAYEMNYNPDNSDIWIQGEFSRPNLSLSNIEYHGLNCMSGDNVQAEEITINGKTKLQFTFSDLRDLDGNTLNIGDINYWHSTQDNPGIWIPHTQESSGSDDIITENEYTSAAVMFVMDCSSSLGEKDFNDLKAIANSFIDRLATKKEINVKVTPIIFDDDTNIQEEYYNLQGIRIEQPSKGIYIYRKGSIVKKIII